MKTYRHRLVVTSYWRVVFLGLMFLGTGCAQVPRESVELSSTVGRDLTELQRSHVATANVLFQRMKDDVNHFVDSQYAPYQIRKTLASEMKDKQAGKEGLIQALEDAAAPNAGKEDTELALGMMQIYVELVTGEIDSYRAKLLAPILAQEAQILIDINESYGRVLYANSIVTGHLASIVKVHDAQEEILNKVGLKDLRQSSGSALVNASSSISKLLDNVKKADANADRFAGVATQIKESFTPPK